MIKPEQTNGTTAKNAKNAKGPLRRLLCGALALAGLGLSVPASAADGGTEVPEGEEAGYYARDKWDLALIDADPAFRMGAVGEGVRIGVLDSGINPVPYLEGRLAEGHNYIEGADETDTADNYGHGTLVAGLIAGSGEDGYLGAAPGAEIVPLKITDGKAITVGAVCRAIYGGIDDYGCDILNLSLGITSDFEELARAVAYAAERGVIIVAAVGNNGTAGRMYPAEYDGVIGVGAVDRDGNAYYHSNHNGSVFLTAPGVNVKTAGKSGGYTTASGTSFAVPYVTAAAAALLGIDPELTPEDVASVLSETARDAGDAGWDEYYGYGILDLGAGAQRLSTAWVPGEHTTPCEFLSAYTLANHTDRDLECTYLSAEYDAGGVCLGVEARQLVLPARGRARLEAPRGEFYGQFVYETATMRPLATARKSLSL